MEEAPMFKMPTIDLSAGSLLMLAQLGFFCVFAYWGYEDAETTIDWVWPVMMLSAGLALFLSVPNARMGATLGIPIVMVVMGVTQGEPEMAVWAFFMLIIVGSLSYIPALAMGDPSLGLDEGSRDVRLKALYTVFMLLMLFMFSVVMPAALDGEFQDDGEETVVYSVESNEQTIAQAGFAMGVIGVLVFIATAVIGMQIGPMRPWHGGALLSGAVFVDSYLWVTVADSSPVEFLFALAAGGIFTLSACLAYEDAHASEAE
tara:strand:+ start:202 stop:981 length:780 start_codon:yes stop_codon:yes gene_type:complete